MQLFFKFQLKIVNEPKIYCSYYNYKNLFKYKEAFISVLHIPIIMLKAALYPSFSVTKLLFW